MLKKFKFVTLAVLLMLPTILFSQITTYSPYSRFGLGNMVHQGSARNFAMGGIGLALRDDNLINPLNPASYSEQDTLSFLFDAGLNGNHKIMRSNTQRMALNNSGLNHILMGFPITRWFKSSIGLLPYSRVGYNIVEFDLVPNIGIIDYAYEGAGGLNKVLWGNAVKLNRYVSVGINASYLFGSLTQSRTVDFPSDGNIFSTVNRRRVIINDFYFTYGLQVNIPLQNNLKLTGGVIFEPKTKASAYNDMFLENILRFGTTMVRDTAMNVTGEKGYVNLPSNFGVGLSLRNSNKFIIGADFYSQDWSNTMILGQTDSLTRSNSIRIGGQFQPEPDDFRNYFNRIKYRAGFYYTQTYLKIRGEQINDFGFSLGLGLPFRNTKTTFNFAIEYGQKGTLAQNLIKENHLTFNFSLSLYDFWFFKRRIE